MDLPHDACDRHRGATATLSEPIDGRRPAVAIVGAWRRRADPLNQREALALTRGQDTWLYALSKRAFDLAVAATALLLASPVMLLIALLVKLSSPGPVLFRQTRCGRHGSPFMCLKFRTMVQDAEDLLWQDPSLVRRFEEAWKLDDDHRVTWLGRWLRRTSLDELPQLINVLRGEMSIVGPRPVQPRELEEQFGEWGQVVTLVRPGLTSLWAVSGRSDLSYERRVQLEVEYVHRRGLLLDSVILLRTIPAVLSRRGAR